MQNSPKSFFLSQLNAMVDYRDVFTKKTDDLSEPNVASSCFYDRMTSTPDMYRHGSSCVRLDGSLVL